MFCLLSAPCFGQVLTNNGSTANILSGTVVSGVDLQNNSGTIINNGTAALQNVTVQSGSTFTNNALLKIAGAMGGTGTVASTTATVEINGGSAQTIPANFFYNNTVAHLRTNNNAGIVLNGSLNIKSTLLAIGGTFNANGYLTLMSDSAGTALIDGSGNGDVTGNVTMQRYLRSGFGYRYISAPFQAAKVAQLADDISLTDSFATLYKYDENVAHAGWVKYIDTSGILYPWAGYAGNFGAVSSPKTINITGVVNNGTISTTLYNNNKTYTLGFNLVGNPYPSPIDWDASAGWTKTNIDNAIYYFNNGTTNRYLGAYRSYINGVSSDGIASNIIPSMQGFFVHVTNGSYPVTALLSADNTVRVNNLSPAYHKQASGPGYPLVRISAGFTADTAFSDPTVVYFDNNATGGFEQNMDAPKMLNTDKRVPSLYSVVGSEKMSINALPEPDVTKSIPLGLKLDNDGEVIFRARDINHLPLGLRAYFADVESGIIQDIEQMSVYKLQLGKGSYEGRFYLVFSRQDRISLPGSEDLIAYTKGNSVFVTVTSDRSELTITNALGQMIRQEELVGDGLHEIRLDAASGIYILSMTSGTTKMSKKVFIGY